MRKFIIGGAAIAIALASSAAFAGEKIHIRKHTAAYSYVVASNESAVDYMIVLPSELSKGASSFLKAHAKTAASQAAINENPALAASLRARGINIKNVLSAQKAMNGNWVIYLK